MRLDIALVHRGGLEFLLDDDVGLGEAGIEVADLNSSRFETLDGLVGAGSTPRVIMSSNSSGASSFIASSTSMTCGSTS